MWELGLKIMIAMTIAPILFSIGVLGFGLLVTAWEAITGAGDNNS